MCLVPVEGACCPGRSARRLLPPSLKVAAVGFSQLQNPAFQRVLFLMLERLRIMYFSFCVPEIATSDLGLDSKVADPHLSSPDNFTWIQKVVPKYQIAVGNCHIQNEFREPHARCVLAVCTANKSGHAIILGFRLLVCHIHPSLTSSTSRPSYH